MAADAVAYDFIDTYFEGQFHRIRVGLRKDHAYIYASESIDGTQGAVGSWSGFRCEWQVELYVVGCHAVSGNGVGVVEILVVARAKDVDAGGLGCFCHGHLPW